MRLCTSRNSLLALCDSARRTCRRATNSAQSQPAANPSAAAHNSAQVLQHAASGHTFQRPSSGSLPPLQPQFQQPAPPAARHQEHGYSQAHGGHPRQMINGHAGWESSHQQPRAGYVLVPLQYTNTFTRESVPGNSGAAHASLQTDLCGYSWPLDAPFPFPTHPAQHHLPSFMAGAGAQHPPPSAFFVHGSVPSFAQQAASLQHAAAHTQTQTHYVPASTAEVGSATNAPPDVGLHHGQMDAFAAAPASPPAGPPPDLSDMLFDFDRFDGDDAPLHHHSGGRGNREDDGDLQDIEAVLAMDAGPGVEATDDLFKLFTRDPEDGQARLTTHLHQPQQLQQRRVSALAGAMHGGGELEHARFGHDL